MLVDAAKGGDVEIPVFCYEPKLGGPVGACRMCLVEIEGIPKLQTACSTPIRDGMVVYTRTDRVHGGPERGGRVPARQPPARLPGLRQGRGVPAAGHRHGLGPGPQPGERPEAPLPQAGAAVAAGADRPRALHPLLPLRALLPGGRRGRAAAAARARGFELRRHVRRPPLHRPVPRQHHRALPGRRAHLRGLPVPRPALGHRGLGLDLHPLPEPVQRQVHGPRRACAAGARPRQPRGRQRLAVRQGPLRLRDDLVGGADHRAAPRRQPRGLGDGAGDRGPAAGIGRAADRRHRRRPGVERGGLPGPADRPRGARLAARDRARRARWPGWPRSRPPSSALRSPRSTRPSRCSSSAPTR